MPQEYDRLACPSCQGDCFVQLVALKYKPGSGLVQDPAGWQCVTCHTKVDTLAMLKAHDVRKKKEELRLLEEELSGAYPRSEVPS